MKRNKKIYSLCVTKGVLIAKDSIAHYSDGSAGRSPNMIFDIVLYVERISNLIRPLLLEPASLGG